MENRTVFIVEDEIDIQELIKYNLEKANYTVKAFSNAEDMLKNLEAFTPSAILLDIMLPGIDGLEACRQVRAIENMDSVAILMLTAKGEESDVVIGLEFGADDYVVKPFSPRVLLARLKAVRRRGGKRSRDKRKDVIVFEKIEIDSGRHRVKVDGKEVSLTVSEFKALTLFISNNGWVFTRSQIVETVHGENYPVTDRSVDVMITGLRKKIGEYGSYIETIRGVGYRFKGEASE